MLDAAVVNLGAVSLGWLFIWWLCGSPAPVAARGDEHPDYWSCEANGHDWTYAGRAEDGTTFYRCRRCGVSNES